MRGGARRRKDAKIQARTEQHPYKHVLHNLKNTETYVDRVEILTPKPSSEVQVIMVSSEQDLADLVANLMLEKELSLSLRYSTSVNAVFTSLLGVSTTERTYLIDAIALKKSLHMLHDVFVNPDIIKIIHNNKRILQCLQRDHNLYLIGMKKVNIEVPRLSKYIEDNYNVKQHDTGFEDWFERPLSQDLILRAINETHYLIPIYRVLRNQLGTLTKDVLQECNDLCRIVFRPKISSLHILWPNAACLKPCQQFALIELDSWRNRLAESVHKHPSLVIRNKYLQRLVKVMGVDAELIIKTANSELVAAHIDEVKDIFIRARHAIGPENSSESHINSVNNNKHATNQARASHNNEIQRNPGKPGKKQSAKKCQKDYAIHLNAIKHLEKYNHELQSEKIVRALEENYNTNLHKNRMQMMHKTLSNLIKGIKAVIDTSRRKRSYVSESNCPDNILGGVFSEHASLPKVCKRDVYVPSNSTFTKPRNDGSYYFSVSPEETPKNVKV